MSEPLRTISLKNGLQIHFYDQTNRYFGDFHRVCIKVTAEVPLSRLTISPDFSSSSAKLPETVGFETYLTRMGVASAALDLVRAALIDDFIKASMPYMDNSDFPQRLLLKNLKKGSPQYSPPPAKD